MGLIHAFEELLGGPAVFPGETPAPATEPEPSTAASSAGGSGAEQLEADRAHIAAAELHEQIAGLEGHVGELEGQVAELSAPVAEATPAPEPAPEPPPKTYPGQSFPTPPGTYGPPGPGGVTPYESPSGGVKVGPASRKQPIRNPHL